MSIRVLVLSVVFVADIVLKMFARSMLAVGERFAFSTPVGLVGFVPSHNDVLAFSLPIPNAWIWPVGWVIVLALLVVFHRRRHCESAKWRSCAIPSEVCRARDPTPSMNCVRFFGRGLPQNDIGMSSHPMQCIEAGEIASSMTPRNDDVRGISNHQLALAALILGALSNLLDRTLRGGVTDYLSFTSLFPAFNLSDLLIIGGVFGWWYCKR